jgi:hypothetical protein
MKNYRKHIPRNIKLRRKSNSVDSFIVLKKPKRLLSNNSSTSNRQKTIIDMRIPAVSVVQQRFKGEKYPFCLQILTLFILIIVTLNHLAFETLQKPTKV